MNKIVIYGAGGFGREVQWLIESINKVEKTWDIIGYVDDGVEPGTLVDGYPVLGGLEKIREYDETLAIVCAIASVKIRKRIIDKIKEMGKYQFPNLIEPEVKMSQRIKMGQGNIICAGNILSVNVTLGDFIILDWSCTV